MFCCGTQIMNNSRICHCLLFYEHGKKNFVQPFCLSRKLLRYTHAWTKLHNKLMSWISGAYECHGPYLKWMQLLCVILRYRLWAACPCLSWSAVALSSEWSYFTEHEARVQIWNPFTQFKFSVCGHMQGQQNWLTWTNEYGLYKLVKRIITKEEPANNTESPFKFRKDLCEQRDRPVGTSYIWFLYSLWCVHVGGCFTWCVTLLISDISSRVSLLRLTPTMFYIF